MGCEYIEISLSVQVLSAKPLCLRAVGLYWLAQMGLMKEKEFHVRSQVTAAFCCHTPFLSHRWCSLILYFLAISCKRTRRSQAGLVAVTVIFSPISFETKKNHDLRARNAGVMVTCRHSLWVAFTCTQGDDPTLIHHPTPT